MATVQTTVEVPDEILKEYDVVGVRVPRHGDLILGLDGEMFRWFAMPKMPVHQWVILRQKIKFPTSLLGAKCAGVAMDANGDWYMYANAAEKRSNYWDCEGECCDLSPFFPDLPKNIPWDKSWIPHPDYKEGGA